MCRSSHQRCSLTKGVLRNFAKFTGKHLCQSFFFNKVEACNFVKKETWHSCFPVHFAKFLRTPSLQSTSGRLLLNVAMNNPNMTFFATLKQCWCKIVIPPSIGHCEFDVADMTLSRRCHYKIHDILWGEFTEFIIQRKGNVDATLRIWREFQHWNTVVNTISTVRRELNLLIKYFKCLPNMLARKVKHVDYQCAFQYQ